MMGSKTLLDKDYVHKYLAELKREYMGISRGFYDMYVTDSPSDIDIRAIRSVMLNYYKKYNLISLFTSNRTMQIDITQDRVQYVRCVLRGELQKNDKDTVELNNFLTLLERYAEYKTAVDWVEDFVARERKRIESNKTKTTRNKKYYAIDFSHTNTRVKQLRFGVTDARYIEYNRPFVDMVVGNRKVVNRVTYDFGKINRDALCKFLKVENSSTKSFVKGMSYEDECRFIKYIILGEIPTDGELGTVLKKAKQQYNKISHIEATTDGRSRRKLGNSLEDDFGFSSKRFTFEEYFMNVAYETKLQVFGEIERSWQDKGYEVQTYNDYMMYGVKYGSSADSAKTVRGNYCIDWGTGRQLPMINVFNGDCGEFVLEDTVTAHGMVAGVVGYELIVDNNGTKKIGYLVSDVCYNDGTPLRSNFSNKGAYNIGFSSVSEAYRKINKYFNVDSDKESTAYYSLLQLCSRYIAKETVDRADRFEGYCKYTATFLLALVKMGCGECNFKMDTVRGYNDMYSEACSDAEILYQGLINKGVL